MATVIMDWGTAWGKARFAEKSWPFHQLGLLTVRCSAETSKSVKQPIEIGPGCAAVLDVEEEMQVDLIS